MTEAALSAAVAPVVLVIEVVEVAVPGWLLVESVPSVVSVFKAACSFLAEQAQ